MQKSNIPITILLIALVMGNIFFIWKYATSQIAVHNLESKIENQKVNDKILLFTQLFMDKVLSGSKEVSFEDRLQLENSVRDLNDKEVFDSWQTFTRAKDQTETQQNFYSLFQLLLKKITL
jgi:hypothetical protein